MANLVPIMAPKRTPKVISRADDRPLRNMRRHGRIACRPPPVGDPLSLQKPSLEKNVQKSKSRVPVGLLSARTKTEEFQGLRVNGRKTLDFGAGYLPTYPVMPAGQT